SAPAFFYWDTTSQPAELTFDTKERQGATLVVPSSAPKSIRALAPAPLYQGTASAVPFHDLVRQGLQPLRPYVALKTRPKGVNADEP
ncbi:MAG TPA: hypothetical protein VHE33_08725, partial [Acidobacteriaceae bacterium]|nr:hypothetical protein [Acidobacteriaceae bacterium]